MKYMHFNSSCAYAALAMLLETAGMDVEDTDIALEMHLPYLFAREGDCFLSGPMLQTPQWFDLYLQPHGLRFCETAVNAAELPNVLRQTGPVMLGLGGHAVMFRNCSAGMYRFYNPKWEEGTEPEELCLSEAELTAQLPQTVYLGGLQAGKKDTGTTKSHLLRSAAVMEQLEAALRSFYTAEQTAQSQKAAMNALFRPILLDGVTMLELIGEAQLQKRLVKVQQAYLQTFREPGAEMPLEELWASMAAYRELILKKACSML